MTVRLSIKYGPIELEYEGDQPLERADILGLLQEVVERGQSIVPASAVRGQAGQRDDATRNHDGLGVASIAAKIGANSGSDLILAACLYLETTAGKNSYDRTDILEAMKTATGFYKDTFRNNLSTYLTGLIRSQKINQNGAKRYSLHQKVKNELEGKLG